MIHILWLIACFDGGIFVKFYLVWIDLQSGMHWKDSFSFSETVLFPVTHLQGTSSAITLKIKQGRGSPTQSKQRANHIPVLLCFGFQCLSRCACVFCEPLDFTRVVNLHSALRCTEAPHHCNRAAGRLSAATSHKSTRKPKTSVTPSTPNAPTLNQLTYLSPG